jgi:selenocysteine-specific elongation factor
MHVVATAGHVDHGKSSLVRALTGMEPDRWAEERRRGLTIDLGFAWTTLPSDDVVAFVDVPGHERFVTKMLAGVGPVPAVMLVVAADEGWMPQTDEHVRALDAFGVRDGLLVVTKSDLADPGPVVDDVRSRLSATSLRDLDTTTASARSGAGLDAVRHALVQLTQRLPAPDVDAPVRLWVDRSFTIGGAGTVVTGTLTGGTIRVGDELAVAGADRTLVVRGLQSRGKDLDAVAATARVAVNLRGIGRDDLPRGTALCAPNAWLAVDAVDVVLDDVPAAAVVTHIGSAAVPTRVRRLGDRAARLHLDRPLPLHYGDRLLLREPSSRQVVTATVADLAPQTLRRRGDGAAVADTLRVPASATAEVRRRVTVDATWLAASGLADEPAAVRLGDRWVDADRWRQWRDDLETVMAAAPADGLPVTDVCERLGLPDGRLLTALVDTYAHLRIDGRVVTSADEHLDLTAITGLLIRLAAEPFAAPDGDEIRHLDRSALSRAVRAGRLAQVAPGVFVAADAPQRALDLLTTLEQPFTVSAAAGALGASRRVVVPLLEHLDATRKTRRLPDGTRLLVPAAG